MGDHTNMLKYNKFPENYGLISGKLSVNPVVLCFIQIFRGGLGHCSRGR